MKKNETISTKDVRIKNRQRVLSFLVATDKPIAKQDLALELSISLPTLNQMLNDLQAHGLIDSSGIADSSGGRKPKLIRLASNAKLAIGLEITKSEVYIILSNLKNETIASEKHILSFENTVEYGIMLSDIIDRFLKKESVDPSKVLGVSIAVPGLISDNMQYIEFAPTLNLLHQEKIRFVEPIRYYTVIENDANCGGHAVNKQIMGNANMAYLSLGKGVGGTMILAGDAYVGCNHSAAEFGHMRIHPGGKICSCGRRGCVEAYCSANCISHDLGMSVDEFFAGTKDNPDLNCILNDYLGNLGIAIENIMIMLDCDVVIGGSLSEYLAPYKEYVEASLRLPGYLDHRNRIVFAHQNSFSVCEGAASLLVMKYLEEI